MREGRRRRGGSREGEGRRRRGGSREGEGRGGRDRDVRTEFKRRSK